MHKKIWATLLMTSYTHPVRSFLFSPFPGRFFFLAWGHGTSLSWFLLSWKLINYASHFIKLLTKQTSPHPCPNKYSHACTADGKAFRKPFSSPLYWVNLLPVKSCFFDTILEYAVYPDYKTWTHSPLQVLTKKCFYAASFSTVGLLR